jgi:hypothetical protein
LTLLTMLRRTVLENIADISEIVVDEKQA